MTERKNLLLILLAFFLTGCGVYRDTPKYNLADGFYHTSVPGKGHTRFYVEHTEESVFFFQETDRGTGKLEPAGMITLNGEPTDSLLPVRTFRQRSFDIDFLTIPFKYRPANQVLPRQFNTDLNGAVYLGYRIDAYALQYRRNPLGRYQQKLAHYGFSGGAFTGLGGTAMSPFVTNSQIDYDYDGLSWSKGIAGIIGLNRFTVGLVLGWDHLLDRNRKFWIYQGKPWVGLGFGLNLN